MTEQEKWNAVVARDAYADGIFVFAVRSTRIYCNPSCPSKRPGKSQVVFFASGREAETFGFRPCLRCKPNEGGRSAQIIMINRVRTYIENNLDRKLTLSILSAQAGISRYHFQRTFKRLVGVSPRKNIQALRLAKMKGSLLNGETVTRAIYKAGFSSRSRFYEHGSHKFGMTPGTLRRGGAGMRITYAIVDSPLGRLLVGGTKFGICAVCIGDSEANLERALAEDYPSAERQRDDGAHSDWVALIRSYLGGKEFKLEVPVDSQGTRFQSRVWSAIKWIPYGMTTTYSESARAIGDAKAVRAVARACATNPVALIVPCHRVIGQDGKLHGYRWGEERKQHLLVLEQHVRS